MAVALKLSRHGVKSKPFYRIVATQKHGKRDGRFLEVLGTYNPTINPALIVLKDDRVKSWLEVGAQPTSVVSDIIKKKIPGFLEEKINRRLAKIKASRKARKLRAKSKDAPAAKASKKKPK